METYETLDIPLKFRSKSVVKATVALWRAFFDRAKSVPHAIDRAIWICNRFPAWIAVKPGYPGEPLENEPEFVVSVVVTNIDELRDSVRAQNLSQREYLKAIEPLYEEYYKWLRSAILESFKTANIQRVKEKVIRGRFGIYSTQIDDLPGAEVSKMDWLAGSKLN